LARTIIKTIKGFEINKYREIAMGIGGPHYCPNFNKIQLKSNVAISHVIPEYALPFTEQMLKEAIAKTQEEIDFAVLDWKGIGNAEERQRIIQILEKNYISYKRTSQVEK
jgi:D-aminoacyl-tRNA deacylase